METEELQERIGREHPLIGEYVVEVSKPLYDYDAERIKNNLNNMVCERDGHHDDLFKIIDVTDCGIDDVIGLRCYMVIRKLKGETDTELGDKVEFINSNLLKKENEK